MSDPTQRIEDRLDRIEKKLDDSLTQMSTNSADIGWVKGYIKTSVAFITALTAGVITSLFNIFK